MTNVSFYFLELPANRKLKFVEFVRLMAALIIDEDENEEPAQDSIRVFDSEELGYISSEELKTALKCMPGSAHMRDFELQDILQKADPNKDGKINIQGNIHGAVETLGGLVLGGGRAAIII